MSEIINKISSLEVCFSPWQPYGTPKQTLPKLPGQLMSMAEVITGFVKPKDKIKSNLLASQKVRIFTKFGLSF